MNGFLIGARTIGIWGLGVEGRAALDLARASGATSILVFDEGLDPGRFPDDVDRVATAGHLADADLVVRSPGVTIHSEAFGALARDVPVTTVTNLWMEQWGHRTLAITGTKGKSTTTAVVETVLAAAGVRARAGGNLGAPLLPTDEFGGSADWFVAEVSSYQAADLRFAPLQAVLTSFHPEHLDWHRTPQQYRHDKLQLTRQSRHVPIVSLGWGAEEAMQEEGIPFEVPRFRTDGLSIGFGTDRLVDLTDTYLGTGTGVAVVVTAVELAAHVGVDVKAKRDEIEAAVRGFSGLPHRCEVVWSSETVDAVDDTLATTPEATVTSLAALGAGRPVVLVAGGQDRGLDFDPLVRVVAARRDPTLVVCVPDSGRRLDDELRARGVETVGASNIEEAMHQAGRWIHDVDSGRPIVLLSPASPSYNQYASHHELSARFVAACRQEWPARRDATAER